MARYLVRRTAALFVALLGVSILTFFLAVLAPGDPAEVVLERQQGQPPTQAQIDDKRHELGLDRPLAAQYVHWLGDAVRGDFGRSWLRGLEVRDAMAERIPRTIALALAAGALAIVVGLPIGVIAATRRNSVVDHLSRFGSLLGASMPSFVAAYILIFVFAVTLKVVPVFGFGSPAHLILPAICLALGPAAVLARLTRSAMLDVLGEDYIRTEWAKGMRRRTVLFRHALKNALIPVVTVIGLFVGHLLGGALIIEWVFAWPGMGDLAVSAIHARDYP
ncbi:MAG: ABC transporter permease, partial [Acidimicrobiales bacterium]